LVPDLLFFSSLAVEEIFFLALELAEVFPVAFLLSLVTVFDLSTPDFFFSSFFCLEASFVTSCFLVLSLLLALLLF
jgi:hypothetical protein